MRVFLAPFCLALLACGGPDRSGMVLRDDGVVRMATIASPAFPVAPDWVDAALRAEDRCRARGYAGADPWTGSAERCLAYDRRNGACSRSMVTRFYPCAPA